ARSLVALGDFALARDGDRAAAERRYAEAHALLAEAPAERERLLGRPEMLDFVAPLTAVDRAASPRPYAGGTTELRLGGGAGGARASARPAGDARLGRAAAARRPRRPPAPVRLGHDRTALRRRRRRPGSGGERRFRRTRRAGRSRLRRADPRSALQAAH